MSKSLKRRQVILGAEGRISRIKPLPDRIQLSGTAVRYG